MNEVVKTEAVEFHGQELITFLVGNEKLVAMKPVVENLSLDWENQRKKINKQSGKYAPTVRSDGVTKYLCIPLKKLNLWLASISTVHIKDVQTRKLVELYQEECAIALHDFWTKGIAIRTTHNSLESLTQEALIEKIVEERLEKKMLAHNYSVVAPDVTYGDLSKVNGLPRTEYVRSYPRSQRNGKRVSPPRLYSDGMRQRLLFYEGVYYGQEV